MTNEISVFARLKLFPRIKNNVIDDGRIISPRLDEKHPTHPTNFCRQCGHDSKVETVSLELCGFCGFVYVDYWHGNIDEVAETIASTVE